MLNEDCNWIRKKLQKKMSGNDLLVIDGNIETVAFVNIVIAGREAARVFENDMQADVE